MNRPIACSLSLNLILSLPLFAIISCSDYSNNNNLHIAVTTSQGTIVEFDSHGLSWHEPKEDESLWEQSLVVRSVSEAWWDYWDEILSKVILPISVDSSSLLQ